MTGLERTGGIIVSRKHDAQYKLFSSLACLDIPEEGDPIKSADDLLIALVNCSDKKGRYFAHPRILLRMCWWEETDAEQLRQWRDELVDRGEITIEPLGRCIYTDSIANVIVIQNPRRFPRFAPRTPIPKDIRQAIYDRDGHACVWCGSGKRLSIDHIVPVSKQGTDDPDNLQTLCRRCNSKKHNMDDHVARERVMGACA